MTPPQPQPRPWRTQIQLPCDRCGRVEQLWRDGLELLCSTCAGIDEPDQQRGNR